MLLTSGAEINLCDKQGQSPLFGASLYGRCDVVKCLLSSGADINLSHEGGQLPLFVASSYGYYDIVRLLTSHGALRDENDSIV
jgi:ankyrin repeat protein